VLLNDALGILAKHRYRNCQQWGAVSCANPHVIGYEASGKSTGSFSYFEAISIAEKLEREAKPTVEGFSVPWNVGFSYVSRTAGNALKNGEDLGPLEWRKQVDRTLENIENTRQCHNDRFHRSETKAEETADRLDDTEYKIRAWGECVSDALKMIVAQDERIAKLEAGIDRIVKCGADLELENEKFKSRLDSLESAAYSRSFLEGKVHAMDRDFTEAIANTVEVNAHDALERRVTDIEKTLRATVLLSAPDRFSGI
jgi:hypothetical protein